MDLSSLTNHEYVTLIGHYNQIGDKSLESQLIARNYSSEKIEKIKAKFNALPVTTVISLNVKFNTNSKFDFIGFNYYYNLFRRYSENGILPFKGCLTDQPAKIIAIFETFEELGYEKEANQIKKFEKNK